MPLSEFSILYDRESDALTKHARYINALERRVNKLEAALQTLASEPGNTHHAAAEALKILNQES